MERSESVYGNKHKASTVRKAEKTKQRNINKYGDDSNANYSAQVVENPYIGNILGVKNIAIGQASPGTSSGFDTDKGIIVGNIRMGFGHYRISMAMASAAHSMGLVPYWMDLNSYPETTGTKVISAQNDLYSMGSRISQKNAIFNKLVWEPVNYTGFKQLSYNAPDQKNAELMAPVFKNVPKDIPVIGTHVWPCQAAIHAGMKYVVNTIPDNWPMALHFSEGAVHTIQCHYAYLGYRTMSGMAGNKVLKPMPSDSLLYTGHYIDDELVRNIEKDNERRIARKDKKKPMRFLLTIGGAGAQKEIFAAIIKELMPDVKAGRAAFYINIGDYKNVWDDLRKASSDMDLYAKTHFNDWEETKKFCEDAIDGDVEGIHIFCHENIYEAVYATNLLMRSCDVLVTKPSELAFYPVPKLFIKRIGGHEQWNAVHSAEMGDGSLECRDIPHTLQMARLFLDDDVTLRNMCDAIDLNKRFGLYDGAYNAVKIAMGLKGVTL